MNINLMLGDCLERMKEIPDGSVDVIITDPPYGTTACKWDTVINLDKMWEQLKRVIKPNGAIVLFGQEPFSSFLRTSNIKMFKYDWIWEKNTASNVAALKYQPQKNFENISVFGGKKYYPIREKRESEESINRCKYKVQSGGHGHIKGLGKTSPIQYDEYTVNPKAVKKFKSVPNSKGKIHPTQKPVALMEYLIKTYTLEGETVLDFTMGSGTTGVACVNTGRNFIGIELDENYFKIAEQRINDVMNKGKLPL